MTREEQINAVAVSKGIEFKNNLIKESVSEGIARMYSNIAVSYFEKGASYADEHPKNLWKDACGTDLPEIDREVIALLTNGKVVFAHRPPERWYGRNMDGEESVFYPKTYDEGEWNQPDVKWWLDIELPKMEE